jgi:hypothetical protein
MPARGTNPFNPLVTSFATNPVKICKFRHALERAGGPRTSRAVRGDRRSVCFRTNGRCCRRAPIQRPLATRRPDSVAAKRTSVVAIGKQTGDTGRWVRNNTNWAGLCRALRHRQESVGCATLEEHRLHWSVTHSSAASALRPESDWTGDVMMNRPSQTNSCGDRYRWYVVPANRRLQSNREIGQA